MQIITQLDQLPRASTIAVIINCSTRWVSTLALASVCANTDLPVLLIDCASTDGSFEHFSNIHKYKKFQFYWIDWPLRRHGETLDKLFEGMPAEQILLVDSDLEIRKPHVVTAMIQALNADEKAYGAGFLHGPEWLGKAHSLPEQVGYYAPRMWIPLVLLRAAAVKTALITGASFAQQQVSLECPHHPLLARWLAYRFRIPILRNWRFRITNAISKKYSIKENIPPAFIDYDTGAKVHQAFNNLGYRFASVDSALIDNVYHYHGVTRSSLITRGQKLARRLAFITTDNNTQQNSILREVKERLARDYGVDVNQIETPNTS